MIDLASTSQDCRGAIERIVTLAHVRDASAEDAVDAVQPRWVVAPGSAAELAGVLRIADENGSRVIPRGGGTKIDWGNPPTGADIVLSTKRLDRVLEHAFGDMTATVQAGCTVADFNQHLAAHEQRLAVDPLWPESATIGGILATNDSGALRATFGALRDQLIGITVALADGTIAKSGGKVVKNVAGFDLPKLFTGSFGTLGVIVEATFRLYPCPKALSNVRFVVPDDDRLGAVLAAMNSLSSLATSVQIEASGNGPTAITIEIEGLADSIDGKVTRIMRAAANAGADCVGSALRTEFSQTADAVCGADPTEISRPAPLSNGQLLFNGDDSCVSRISLLPTHWPAFLKAVRGINAAGLRWEIIGQAIGVGLLGLRTPDVGHLSKSLLWLREYLNQSQGSLIVLRWSAGIGNRIDAWPAPFADFPLMRRIKEQFDPNMILSPGRFMGGI